jgi:hypothetical protein
MRVVLDVAALGSGLGGDETWVRGLLDGLADVAAAGDEFPLLVPHGTSLPDVVRGHELFPARTVANGVASRTSLSISRELCTTTGLIWSSA